MGAESNNAGTPSLVVGRVTPTTRLLPIGLALRNRGNSLARKVFGRSRYYHAAYHSIEREKLGRRIEVMLGGERGIVEMLEDKAPRTCEHVWQHLPVESFCIHAKFAGSELIVMAPYYLDTDENTQESVMGDVAYYPGRQTLCMWYGPAAALGKAPTFGRIVEGIDALARAGARILREGSLPAVVRRLDGEAKSSVMLPQEPEPEQAQVRSYIAYLKRFLNYEWDREPEDMVRARQHQRPAMGNIPCLLYANFDLFWAGENLEVCRGLAKDGAIPLQHVNKMAGRLLRRTAGRLRLLSKWSFTDTPAVIEDVANFLCDEGVSNERDFVKLIEQTILAIGRMANWTDRAIPWSDLDSSLTLRR